ncbi:MAG: hypothetical protein Q7S77_00855 [Candidatus Staskawiczbacteria bacterium]|nr:hypothetical protein [Candidatus Staskawiczbacteria bacterium]
MKEISKGLYEMEHQEEMPCLPSKIYILRWALPNTLDKSELEESAARILSFSQEQDKWVGVSWSLIINQIKTEYEIDVMSEKIRTENRLRQEIYGVMINKYLLFCIITLGLWYFLKNKPEAPQDVRIPNLPLSIVSIYGSRAITQGVAALLNKNLIRLELSEESKEQILFPTPLLIKRIMQAQKIT